ncbi:DNA internalization-related competence protein ComEC/Rec2 [Thiobacter aerophilum]|uniref:DNA internalization-related competence protein ComEC/Rec2 n=1 Tax=Thiobacter aerophilum TaxID=3121275 RepID=UPI003D300C9D
MPAVVAGLALLPHSRLLAWIMLLAAAFAAGYSYAGWRAALRLADTLPPAWEGRDIQVVGVVAGLPQVSERGLRFAFDVEQVLTPGAQVPHGIQLFWFRRGEEAEEGAHLDPARLRAGERWQFRVRLKRPHGTANPYGFDYEYYLLERGIRATGYVRKDPENFRIDSLVIRPAYLVERARDHIARQMREALAGAPYAGVLIALAIGDQGSIPQDQWRVFTRTGINHLVAISGLHVTLFSGLVFALVQWGWRRSARLTQLWPAKKVALIGGVTAAFAYALLTGFAVPAQRTFYMVVAAALAVWRDRYTSPSRVLAFALAVVVLLDPWAIKAAGFWLSFGAVALIFYVASHRLARPGRLLEAAQVQWAVTVGLIPPLMVLFQQTSLVSPLANAWAIPLVSFLVVPLVLIGAFLGLAAPLHLAHALFALGMLPLAWLAALPAAVWQQHAPPLWTALVASLGAAWLLAPRGFPGRWAGACAFLPLFLLAPPPLPTGVVEATVLDVGQGLAVVLRTREHALLFDAGPRFDSDVDSGSRIVLPYLRAMGVRRLDGLVVSHADNDHAGSAGAVLDGVPVGWFMASLPAEDPLRLRRTDAQPCRAGTQWRWDGVDFRLLHPSAQALATYRKANDRGCVLQVEAAGRRLIIAADIEARAERELVSRLGRTLASDVLVVPHHGSRTSSSVEFIASVAPDWAVFTVGYRNRFGHPKAEVVERYRLFGSRLLRSDESGAVIFRLGPSGIDVAEERKVHPRYWRSGATETELISSSGTGS